MLTYKEKEHILSDFPNIELSYEIHKKVHEIFLTIPKGRKYFAWFRHWGKHPVCFILSLHRGKIIQDIEIRTCCFHRYLCIGKGTILYGTIFSEGDFFNVEDIFYCKGEKIRRGDEFEKMDILCNVFNNYIKQFAFSNRDLVFGLPIIDQNYNNLLAKVDNLPYDLYCIQCRSRRGGIYNRKIKRKTQYGIFCIKATVDTDIYSLYCLDRNGKCVQYGIADIPDYKTSCLMNGLFRNIKENRNLDLLEESDDEDEFENTDEAKYVDLDKEIIMQCVYNSSFKRWRPLKKTREKITYSKEISLMEKK
tara:strand:- start:823 stop:1740 length:918 start_codon:yes stop_codon:yes gene_type:complete